MSVNTIWVVIAEEGEYSDRDVWVQAAFSNEANAQAYCDTISAATREHSQQVDDWFRTRAGEEPRFEFGGVTCRRADHYNVEEVPMLVPHHAADGAIRHFCSEAACPDLTTRAN